jgi:phosphatidate cytidylyltransferase
MAIHFKKLGPRAASALVFVFVLLLAVLTSYLTFTLFFLLVSLLGLMEYFILCEKLGIKVFKLVGFICGLILYFGFIDLNYLGVWDGINLNFYLIVLIPFLLFCAAIFRNGPRTFSGAIYTVAGLVYCVLPFALIHEIVFKTDSSPILIYSPAILLGIVILIWTNDTFAYLGGSMFGRHKMIERVSPGKTWEGTAIGILACFGISFLVAKHADHGSADFWIVAGILVPVLATIGDLAQSTLKREADVKDTGRIMPGHGGILDRFDSLIFVSPFVVVVLKLISLRYISG